MKVLGKTKLFPGRKRDVYLQLSKIMGISMDHLTMEACLGNKDWASTIASNEKKLTSALEKIMSDMAEIE